MNNSGYHRSSTDGPVRPSLEELDTPAVVVDLDIMDRNLARMAALCRDRGTPLRPHTKTHKSVEIARKQLELGASGITVAKLGEAEVMAEHGFRDILLAYEVVGPQKMERLKKLLASSRQSGFKLTMAVDTVEGAAVLSNASSQAGVRLPVLIEIDTGLGRTGVSGVEEAVSLARHIRLFPGLIIDGIMTHEGHIGRDGPGAMEPRAAAAAAMMNEIAGEIRALGVPCETISMGSTPAAKYLAGAPGVTELRPGTYVFQDRTQLFLGVAGEEDCALTVLSTIVSVHGGRVALDAGSKSLTSDAVGRLGGYGLILGDPEAHLAACSEEHGHLDVSSSKKPYRVGDRVHILPNHVCPVVNLTDRVYGYRDGRLEADWAVASRGRVQ